MLKKENKSHHNMLDPSLKNKTIHNHKTSNFRKPRYSLEELLERILRGHKIKVKSHRAEAQTKQFIIL